MRATSYGLLTAAIIAIPAVFASDPALALSRGVKQPDGMVCRELFRHPHMHHGRGRGDTRKHALAKAMKRWRWFVRFEYGQAWGDWRIARKKNVQCWRGRAWRCKIKAQPCKH